MTNARHHTRLLASHHPGMTTALVHSLPQICIGPVCVPLNLFLPFLLGILHRYGYLTWVKKEWVTWRYWRQRFSSKTAASTAAAAQPSGPKGGGNTAASEPAAAGGNSGPGGPKAEAQGSAASIHPAQPTGTDTASAAVGGGAPPAGEGRASVRRRSARM